ncbi:MAG TPA: type I methionyl aminopeptidase [Thermomicrobiales bacterium]|nr:type I methionyl aminopeptidase [Thermomicrobiales bacterium]
MGIPLRSAADLEKMKRAGHVVALCHQRVEQAIAPGVTTQELDDIVRDTLAEMGATSNFLGHHGFTGRICASVNDEVVHGIPGLRRLNEGDIIAVDIGAIVDGFHGDSAWTYPVGSISEDNQRLLRDTEGALNAGLAKATAGNRLGDIGFAVEEYASSRGLGILREWGGHGIGRQMWEEPHIPNWGDPGTGLKLKKGMTLAIEPMLTLGGDEVRELEDGWTVVTVDGSTSAHFEHTIAITDGEPLILTERLATVLH